MTDIDNLDALRPLALEEVERRAYTEGDAKLAALAGAALQLLDTQQKLINLLAAWDDQDNPLTISRKARAQLHAILHGEG